MSLNRFLPSNRICPDVGLISPMMAFINTVFPQPLSPTIATVCPLGTEMLMSRSTFWRPKVTWRPVTWTRGISEVVEETGILRND